LDGNSGAITAFAHDLRGLRRAAGSPSYRDLARTALFSPSVLSSAASGHRLPTLAVTLAFVAACDGDRAAWERRWRTVAGTSTATPQPRAERQPALAGPARAPGDAERSRPLLRALAGEARPAQLPMGPATFVGRGAALAAASAIIGRAGSATTPLLISGPIGIGKSALALRLADDLAADFPDGQLYADLGAGEPGTGSTLGIIRGFVRALGLPSPLLPDEPTQLLGLYRSLLANRRLFVLLANVRDEHQVRPLLGRATHSQVVMTSRARLLGLDGVHRVDLDGFTRQESITLLGRLAGAERVLAERDAADALAEMCEDLPLAVNIVGRMIAARPERTIAYTAGLLVGGDRLLDNLSVGDVTVRDRLASAYRGLSPAGRRALHRLGQVGAGWTTAIGLAAAANTSIAWADDMLESLVDAGLVTRATVAGRYRVSRLVGAFTAAVQRDAAPAAVQRDAASAAVPVDRRGQRSRPAAERRRTPTPLAPDGVMVYAGQHLMRRPIRACGLLGGYGG
jgi:hypothetical protein